MIDIFAVTMVIIFLLLRYLSDERTCEVVLNNLNGINDDKVLEKRVIFNLGTFLYQL